MRTAILRLFLSAGAALLLAVAPAAAAGGAAHVQTASDGALSASYSYSGRPPFYHSDTLTIRDHGHVVYSRRVNAPLCGHDCSPGATGPHASSLQFAVFTPGSTPVLVLNLYSGGAHCCTTGQVFAPHANGTWTATSHMFGDPGYRLADLGHNGVQEFLSADDTFAYAFTDYAASGMPLQIMGFAHHRFLNLTRQYPRLIASDARVWMRAFRAQRSSRYADTTGLVAAWAADEDELGHSAEVARFLRAQAAAGHLNSPLAPSVPQGQRFVSALNRLLRRLGYLTPAR